MNLLKNTMKLERNRASGNLELTDSSVLCSTSDALEYGEGPSPVCTGTCALVRAEDNTELLTLQSRQISCSKARLG